MLDFFVVLASLCLKTASFASFSLFCLYLSVFDAFFLGLKTDVLLGLLPLLLNFTVCLYGF